MKNILLILPLFLLFCCSIFGQVRPTGLIFDNQEYQKTPLQPNFSGAKYDEVKLQVDLKKYCPIPGDQGELASGVGWATGYGLLTISRAIQLDLTDRSEITRKANSALFIYNQIKPQGTDGGASLHDAMQLLKDQGSCLSSSFDVNVGNSNILPSADQKSQAREFSIADYVALFRSGAPDKVKIKKIQQSLSVDKPVVIGMKITSSFFSISSNDQFWNPSNLELEDDSFDEGGHAMVVVGYQDGGYFEVMNSFGPTWGNKGFIKIKEAVFAQLCQYAFNIALHKGNLNHTNIATNNQVATTYSPLTGTFEFKALAKDPSDAFLFKKDNLGNTLSDPYGNPFPEYYQPPIQLKQREGIYSFYNPIKSGTAFQLIAREIPESKYIYVFSIDANNNLSAHFPKKETRVSSFIPDPTAELIIPSRSNILKIEKGKDDLIILFSNIEIKDYHERLERINGFIGANTFEKMRHGFKDLLFDPSYINYQSNAMSFSTNPGSLGSIVPIILSGEGR